jgi:hypothetical protein
MIATSPASRTPCPADHDDLIALPTEAWRSHTAPLVVRGGADYPGTECRNCACGSTLTRVHDQAALDAYMDADAEPTQPLCRPLPEYNDPIWSLGLDTARLVVDFVLDDLPGARASATGIDAETARTDRSER